MRIPWNKGLTKDTDERVARFALDKEKNLNISRALKGIKRSEEFKQKHREFAKTERGREISAQGGRKAQKNPNCVQALLRCGELRKQGLMCSGMKGKKIHNTEKYSIATKKKWENPEYAKKVLGLRGKSNEEKHLYFWLEEKWPGYWKYVGDAKYRIGRKFPDFINLDNRKIIELWGDYYHKGQNPQNRIDYFRLYGFDCVIIWASEMHKNKSKVLDMIETFMIEEALEL